MPFFINPFKKHDVSEFPGVFEPLGEAQRHHSVIQQSDQRRASAVGVSGDGSDAEKKKGRTSREGSDPESGGDVEVGEVGQYQYSAHTIEGLRAEIESDVAAAGVDSMYDRKSKIINKAIQDIGMGRYQWQLFALCGFGWLADNLWLQGVALTLPQLTLEFGVGENEVRYTTCALFVGLCVGASFWGTASDVIGRRLAFNFTLMLAGIFGLVVGAGNSWLAVCAMYAALGFGVGGNLPVDGALFLEFLPMASGNMLTMLSVWWPVGNLIGAMVAWGLITNYSCDSNLQSCYIVPEGMPCCHSDDNRGWRYTNITLGAMTFLMFVCRFFLFHLFESPKFLLSRGRQTEAVATVHGIAWKNHSKTWLTEEILNEIGGIAEGKDETKLPFSEIVRRTFSKFSGERIAPLFATRKLGAMTALIWFCWATIGMGYPLFNAFLPQYLSNSGGDVKTPVNIQYRNYAITSVVGVPGSILACFLVDVKYIGRKGTIAASTLITGILLFCFTLSTDSNVQVAMSSLEAFFQNIMYGVLYAYTPEVFPAPNRGTGTGIASFFNRVAGLCAPIVAINAGGANPNAPIYASGGLMLAAFVAMCLFPIETRGKQSL